MGYSTAIQSFKKMTLQNCISIFFTTFIEYHYFKSNILQLHLYLDYECYELLEICLLHLNTIIMFRIFM